MTKKATNAGKAWTDGDVQQLQKLAAQNTPTRVMGLKLGRSEVAIRSQARKQDLSLKPVNQSPYNRTKK